MLHCAFAALLALLPSQVNVSNASQLRAAFSSAAPGTTIVLANGVYDLAGSPIPSGVNGTPGAPITVRSQNPLGAVINTNGAEEAFYISHSYYTFDGLLINVTGAGSFHAWKLNGANVSPGATTAADHAIIRNSRCVVSTTGESCIKGSTNATAPYPDNVTISGLNIIFPAPSTNGVVEGIDAVGVANWNINSTRFQGVRGTNTTAWGVVLKGNSMNCVIERNYFIDGNIHISVGGTTSPQYYRNGDSTYEHRNGIVRNNVLIRSTDVGIYLEKANNTQIYNNTITEPSTSCAGCGSSIDVRYTQSTADIRNNITSKPLNPRDGGTFTQSNNLGAPLMTDFVSYPTNLRINPGTSLFSLAVDKGMALPSVRFDFATTPRPQGPAYDIGAFETTFAALPDAGVAPDATVNPDAGVTPPDAGCTCCTPCPCLADAGTAPDAVAQADASQPPPDAGVTIPDAGSQDATTVSGITLLPETGHGLPACYRCGVGTADFDGDGLIDVVMAGAFDSAYTANMGSCTYNDRVRLFKNVSTKGGAIRFQEQPGIQNFQWGCNTALRVGDFNGDGKPDFLVQTGNGETPLADNSAFINNGAWGFTRAIISPRFDMQDGSMGIAVGDIDHDGADDVIFASDGGDGFGPGLWYKFTNGAWVAQQTTFSHKISYGGSITLIDVNGDGWLDAVVAGNSNQNWGNYNCASTLMYGEIHLNTGPSGTPGIDPNAFETLGAFALKSDKANPPVCTGGDNEATLAADVDGDGHPDLILAGSFDAFNGPVGMNGIQYDFAVLRNIDGTGKNFVTFENPGVQLPGGETNGGSGNVSTLNIAAGDLDGDGYPEVFISGHHRDNLNVSGNGVGYYVFDSWLFHNDNHGAGWTRINLPLANVAEGGQAIVDLNGDGLPDLLFTGATIPWHSNGTNGTDTNTAATLNISVYRNQTSVPLMRSVTRALRDAWHGTKRVLGLER